jgi:hypothetical protein
MAHLGAITEHISAQRSPDESQGTDLKNRDHVDYDDHHVRPRFTKLAPQRSRVSSLHALPMSAEGNIRRPRLPTSAVSSTAG